MKLKNTLALSLAAVMAAGLSWNGEEAHSAVYDTERTAELFCKIVNAWPRRTA